MNGAVYETSKTPAHKKLKSLREVDIIMFFSMKKNLSQIFIDYKMLLRSIPSLTITVFILSVVCANLMANKELINNGYVALDCGFVFSWIMFLCMDVICKHWGAKASIKISILAMVINLFVCLCFAILSKTKGMWGEYYSTGSLLVNNSLNKTFGGSWYIVLGSAVAFLVSSVINALLNSFIGSKLENSKFIDFAFRCYVSTFIAQFADNFIFAVLVSKIFFGWTWKQVVICSLIGAFFELLCEVLFSGMGYKVVKSWEKENVGMEYFNYQKYLNC